MSHWLFQENKPVFDPALGDPLGKAILDEARQGKLDTLLREINLLRDGEWDRRAFYIDLAGEYLDRSKNPEKFPDTSLGNLVKGAYAINYARKARGSGTADTVSKKGWDLFFERLDIARKSLLRATEQDPEDPTPFAFLQTVAQGLQLNRKIAEVWLNEAIQRDPINQQAHYRHLFLLCKKWGGSHKEMYAFAYTTMRKLPPGSTLHSLVYLAFQEHYLYLDAFDRNAAEAKAFLHDETVREESIKVYQRSFEKQQVIKHVSDYWPHNVAAWWFLTLNMPTVVRQETKKIGPNFTRLPWIMFYRDAAVGYQKALDF